MAVTMSTPPATYTPMPTGDVGGGGGLTTSYSNWQTMNAGVGGAATVNGSNAIRWPQMP